MGIDAPGIAILTAYGVAKAVATGYTLVLHVALWLPITALGALFMLLQHVGWRDFGRAGQARLCLECEIPVRQRRLRLAPDR